MTRLIPPAALAVVAVIVTAGCASATASGPGALDGAASVVPGDAVAFVAANTDLTSAQWHTVGDVFLNDVEQQTKLSWRDDVKPALGDEVDIAVLKDKQVVTLTQPRDDAKLAALAKKYNVKTRKVGDWTAIAKTDTALQELGPSALSLAENNLFRAAMTRTPADALVRAYVSGARMDELVASLPGQLETSVAPFGAPYHYGKPRSQRSIGPTLGRVEFRWAGAALTDAKGGLKLEGFAHTGELISEGPPRYITQPTPAYVSSLVDEIPADVLAVADFPMPLSSFELVPKLPAALEKLFGKDVYNLPVQLDTIFGGETALYVRAALPTPELTLVTSPDDTAAASSTLDNLLKTVPKTSPLSRLTLHRAVLGGQFVVSTSQHGIDEFRGAGPKLSAQPAFVEAEKLSGMPEEITGFAYANVKAALPLLALAGVKLPAQLPDFRNLLAFGSQGQDERLFTTYIQVGNS
jgi:hypothetical protein